MVAKVEVLLLGVAQDAGLPQAGCDCVNCSDARTRAYDPCVVSLGIIDHVQLYNTNLTLPKILHE